MAIESDKETEVYAATTTLALGRKHRLTSYDAAYLELAMRRGAALATLDKNLRKAGPGRGRSCPPARDSKLRLTRLSSRLLRLERKSYRDEHRGNGGGSSLCRVATGQRVGTLCRSVPKDRNSALRPPKTWRQQEGKEQTDQLCMQLRLRGPVVQDIGFKPSVYCTVVAITKESVIHETGAGGDASVGGRKAAPLQARGCCDWRGA